MMMMTDAKPCRVCIKMGVKGNVKYKKIYIFFTFLFDRCNIPLATSLAIVILSTGVKCTALSALKLMYWRSRFFLRWLNKQPFSASRTITNIGSGEKKNDYIIISFKYIVWW